MSRTITAMFDNRADAEAAQVQLASAGVAASDVQIMDQGSMSSSTTSGYATSGTSASADQGIWASIKSMFSDDGDTYEEGMRRGGFLLTARVEDAMADRAIDILDDSGTVDTEARSEEWRTEGWTGGAPLAATDRMTDSGEQRIPIVEEQLRVGKREVSRGGVRVRSYVVEDAVHEDVSLRQEHVNVERRPATGAADAAMFKDRTIEVSETSEEAVIDKQAMVREEVVVSKTVDDTVQRIDDTVRRTEVDIDKLDASDARRSTTDDGMGRSALGTGIDRDGSGTSLGDKVAGLAKEGVGNVKQGLGSVTGSDNLKQDGLAQERRGEMQQGSRDRT